MRRGSKPELVYSEDKRIIGINLSSDFTAEHEWGIKNLQENFGINNKIEIYGLNKRKISRIPEDLFWVDGKVAGFGCAYYYKEHPERLVKERELDFYKGSLVAAWDGDSFGVIANEQKEIDALKEIYEQFAKLNIFIMLGGGGIFQNAGLIIGIADRLPEETIKMWEKTDRDNHEIRNEFKATGIEKLLAEKGKQYFALSPKRDKDGSLIFWLNPMEQKKNNFGWFKLEDLKEWAEGKGKIPIEEKK